MSRTIKVDDEVYQRLDNERQKGETFSQVVAWLLRVAGQLKEVARTLGPSHYLKDVEAYREHQEAASKR